MQKIITKIYQRLYPTWKHVFAKRIKERRLNIIKDLSKGVLTGDKPAKVLDLGCNTGMDFLIHFEEKENLELHGIDIENYPYDDRKVNFQVTNGDNIPYEDNYFDLTVSIGVLEHIQPIEKLTKVVREINRVSKNYVVIVPSIGTVLEPHAVSLFWPIRSAKKKVSHAYLNYFSDEAWMQFEGFLSAQSKRFWYIPGLIKNYVIWK